MEKGVGCNKLRVCLVVVGRLVKLRARRPQHSLHRRRPTLGWLHIVCVASRTLCPSLISYLQRYSLDRLRCVGPSSWATVGFCSSYILRNLQEMKYLPVFLLPPAYPSILEMLSFGNSAADAAIDVDDDPSVLVRKSQSELRYALTISMF